MPAAVTPTIDTFIHDLENELRENKISILDAEFLTALEEKSITRAQICEWAKTFYAATRHGRLTIANFYANAPDDPELRRELAENIYEEECGGISGVGMCHMDVFQFLLDGLGVSKEEAERFPNPHGADVSHSHVIPQEEYYAALSAYGFSVEIPNAEFCERAAKALRDNYGFSSKEVRWFTMHAELDAGHGEEFRKHALKVAATPGGLEVLREKTLALSRATMNVWNGYDCWKRSSS